MIVRAARRQKFTVVNNVVLNDARLSFRAKGVLLFVLAKPDDWAISERSLAQEGPDGRSAIASALGELEEAGYLQRRRVRNSDGTLGWQSTVFDEPQAVMLDTPTSSESSPESALEPAQEPAPEPPVEEAVEEAVKEAVKEAVEEAMVDRCEPGGGSQRSTMAGKTGHGFTVHGKPSHIIKTEQLSTTTEESSSSEEDGTASAVAAVAAELAAWYEPELEAPTSQPSGTVKAMTSQPVVAIYRDVFLRYPSKAQMAYLLSAGIADLRRWHEVLGLWVGRGWSPTNCAGMVDLYNNPQRIRELSNFQEKSNAKSTARTNRRPASGTGGVLVARQGDSGGGSPADGSGDGAAHRRPAVVFIEADQERTDIYL